MINSEHLCMSCMKEIGAEATNCPNCGYVVGTPQISPYLPVRTVVGNRYLIGKLLEYNGDGATYIAWDIAEQRAVKVREFLPDTLCTRARGDKNITVTSDSLVAYNDCMSDFLELWRKLTRMSGLSALENVYDVFEENSTAYAICEYIESISLRDYLTRVKAGYIPWEKAKQLFMPVLSTLGMLHTAGIIHRGISPVTLHIGRDGKMRIGGFSIWQARTARGELTAQIFPGYAAVEQYGFDGQQGPWTDVYSFGATLYRTLIGTDPIEATERLTNDRLMVPAKFAEMLPDYVINGLINSLQILPEDRTRSVEQLRAELSASSSTMVNEVIVGSPAEEAQPESKAAPQKPMAKKSTEAAKTVKDENKMIIIKTALISAMATLVVFLIVVLAAGDRLGLTANFGNDDEMTTSSELVEVPTFVNRTYSEVISTAFWINIYNFESVEVYSDTVEKGIIIDQNIAAGTSVNKGTKIVLTVSKGIEQLELPYIVGMDFDTAKEMLTSRNFVVEKEIQENDGTHTANEVQSIVDLTPGKYYPKGTRVKLLVWGEAPEVTTSFLENIFGTTDKVTEKEPTTAETPLIPSAPSTAPTTPITPTAPVVNE